jgi:hypothetical protein
MIGVQACQKGGSMRSKSVLAQPRGEEAADTAPTEQRPLPPRGSLTLVDRGQSRPAGAKKHGLY